MTNNFDEKAVASSTTFVVLLVLLAVSLSLNVWLGRSVRASHSAATMQASRLRMGEAVTGGQTTFVHARDMEGRSFSMGNINRGVIYYFSPTCRWCAANLPSIQSLASQVSSNYQVIGLVRDRKGVQEYLRQHPQTFPIIFDDNESDLAPLDLRGTPQTVLVEGGTVKHNWLGAYQGHTKDAVEHALNARLPDPMPASQ